MDSPQEFLSPAELAEWLGVPRSTIYEWRYSGTGPPAVKLGRHVRFRMVNVLAWLDERAQADAAANRR